VLDAESQDLLEDILPRYSPGPHTSPEEKRHLALELGKLLQGDPPQLRGVLNYVVPTASGGVSIRIYYSTHRPRSGWLLWLHGGGFTTGSLDTHDTLCRRLAVLSSQAVISVDYRLAPENPYPAALQDSYDVLGWIMANAASLSLNPVRGAIGGSSAGGNLAAATSLMNRDRGGPGLLHQLLVYPSVDATLSSDSVSCFATGYQLTTEMMRHYLGNYIGSKSDLKDPYLSPLWAPDHARLPPTHIVIAELDPLADEGAAYAQRLQASGVPVEVTRYDGVMHGFFAQAGVLAKARAAQELACTRLSSALRGSEES
jgi:acetyl esterase